MHKIIVIGLLIVGTSVAAMAAVPEIDPASGGSALALIGAGLMILRSRRKK